MDRSAFNYYSLIDKGHVGDVLKLFSPNIVYLRNDLKIFGLKELEDFFINKRNLRGKHKRLTFERRENSLFVTGIFEGLRGSESVSFKFTDEFWFDAEGYIVKRISLF